MPSHKSVGTNDQNGPEDRRIQPIEPNEEKAIGRTFLRNHAPDIAAIDLFVVPTNDDGAEPCAGLA
jgi:hypothetical protein